MESARPSIQVTVREVWERSTGPSCPSTASPETLFLPKSTLSRQLRLAVPLNEIDVTNSQDRVDAAAKRYAAAALLAVAIYNAIEMIPIVYFTFSSFSGLYFWSMVTAVTGVLINAVGFGKDLLDEADNLLLLRSDNSGLASLTPMPQDVL